MQIQNEPDVLEEQHEARHGASYKQSSGKLPASPELV